MFSTAGWSDRKASLRLPAIAPCIALIPCIHAHKPTLRLGLNKFQPTLRLELFIANRRVVLNEVKPTMPAMPIMPAMPTIGPWSSYPFACLIRVNGF